MQYGLAYYAIETKDGKISEDSNHTAIFGHYADAMEYVRLKTAQEENRLIYLPNEIPDLDAESLQYAITYAINMVRFGVETTPDSLESACELSKALSGAYMRGVEDGRTRFGRSE